MDKNPISTILIIDDEWAMREAMLELLANEGHHILAAEDGAKGLAKAAELAPDLILLDIRMPEMDGFEVCRRLRADPLLAEVPVIMVTSLTDRDSRLQGFEVGADDFVSKPFDEIEFLTRVRSITRLNRYRRLLQAQEAVQESEERYRRLFEQSNDAVFIHDLDGRISDVNSRACEMTGYSRDQLLSMRVQDLHTAETCPSSDEALQTTRREGAIRFESQLEKANGTILDIDISSGIVDPEKGLVQGIVRNITERKQAQEALQRERDRAQQHLDIAEVILVAINQEGEITLINRKGCSTLERKEAELLGKNWFDTCLPARMRQDVKAVFDRLTTGEIEPVEYYENPVITKSGAERLIAWHNTVLRDEAGHIVGTLSSGEDVTDQRRAQEAYRALVDHSLQGLAILQDGCIVFANQALAEIGGYTVEELCALLPEETEETVHPQDRETVVGYYQDQMEGRQGPERFAFRAIRKDGTIRWLEGYASRIEYQGRPAVQAAYVDITERVRSEKERAQAEEALRESEEKYRNVVEHAHEAIVVIQDEMFKFFNPEAVEITGYSLEELASISLAELVYPDDREAGIERQRRRLNGEEIPPVEVIRIIDKQGNVKWVENNSIVIAWEGKPATLHFISDITERRKAEEALRQSESKFRNVIEQASDGIMLTDEQGHVVEWNQAQEQMTGLSRAEVLGQPMWGIQFRVMPEERRTQAAHERLKASQLEMFATGRAPWLGQLMEHAIQRPDGTCRTIQTMAFPVETERGMIVGSVSRDITEQKQAEEQLRTLSLAIEQSASSIAILSKEGTVEYANPKLLEPYGYDPEKVVGTNWRSFLSEHSTLWEKGQEIQDTVIRKGLTWKGEVSDRAINGKTVWRQATIFPIRNAEGEITHYVYTSEDITDRRHAEEALHIQRDLGITLASTSDLTEALRQVLEAALQIERVDCGGVYRIDKATGQLNLIVHQGLSPQFIERTSHYAADAPQTRLIMAGEPIYQRYDRISLGKRDPVRQSEGLRALAVIPIQYEGQIVAVLNLASHTHDEIPASTRGALEAIAAQIGSVIARLEAEAALQESEEKHRTLFETMTQGVLYWDAEGRIVSANPAAERILGLTLDQMQGKAPIDPRWRMVRQDGSEIPEETLPAIAALRSGEEMRNVTIGFFNPVLEDHRWVNVNAVPMFRPGEGRPYGIHSIFEDITEHVQAEAEIKQRNLELAALNEIGQAITSTLDLRETLTTIADHTTRLMSMAATSVVLYDQASDDLYFAAASGEGAAHTVGQRLALGQGIAGWVVQHGEPALVPDVSQDPRWFQGLDTGSGFVTHSILCVPLRSKGRTIGALEAINKEYGFSQDDLNLLSALTAQVATAIDNAQLFEEVRAGREQLQGLSRRLVEVQEAERAHIARELHDETGQALSSLLLSLGLLEQQPDCPPEAKERITQMEALIDEMLENLHRLSMNLRPATLDHLGLAVALEQYVETFGEQHPFDARFEAVGLEGERLPPEMETALYRIVQEALTNVLRHAQATRVDVLLEQRGNLVVTIVEDDGVGFDPEEAKQSGRLGLFGMRERAEMLGGTLVIESAAGAGTTVFVEVPYPVSLDHV